MCVDPDPAIGDPPTAADFIVIEHLQVFLVTFQTSEPVATQCGVQIPQER